MTEPVIDAHIHLGPPKYATIEQFTATARAERIAGALLVQHMGNTDNSYLADVRSTEPERFVALAIVDSVEQVARVLSDGFAGLRLGPLGLPEPSGQEVFDALDAHGAAVSVTGPPDEVVSDAFLRTVRAHPRVRFRIEHVGGFRYGETEADRLAFRRLLRLADEPNVTLMWSGFFLNAGTDFPYPNTHAFLAETLAAYGSERIMWSGDWNREGLAAGDYRRAIELVGLVVNDPEAQADILRRTAIRVFGIGSVSTKGA